MLSYENIINLFIFEFPSDTKDRSINPRLIYKFEFLLNFKHHLDSFLFLLYKLVVKGFAP